MSIITGSTDEPFTLLWYLFEQIHVIPTQPGKPKHVEKGYTRASVCTLADFHSGRGAKIVTGPVNGGPMNLYALDDDSHGQLVTALEALAPQAMRRLDRWHSTCRRGFHIPFYTHLSFETMTLIDQVNGEMLGELKGNGGWITAPSPDRYIGAELPDDFPFLPPDEADELQAALLLLKKPESKPERTKRPVASLVPFSATQGDKAVFDIGAYCKSVDLAALLESDGATYAREAGGVLQLHCYESAHAHGDRNSSLRIYTSSKYGQVVKCNHPGCPLYQTRNAFSYECYRRGLTATDLLKEISPLDQQAIARAKDAERKRTERAPIHDSRMAELQARLDADTTLPDRARKLAAVLLVDGLQSRKTNAQLAEMLGVHPNTIVNAFRDLAEHDYGRRAGGFLYGSKGIPAVWTFLDHKAPISKPSVNIPIPLDCDAENAELVILKESIEVAAIDTASSLPFSQSEPIAEPEGKGKEENNSASCSYTPTLDFTHSAHAPVPTDKAAPWQRPAFLRPVGSLTPMTPLEMETLGETQEALFVEPAAPPAQAGNEHKFYSLMGAARRTTNDKQKRVLRQLAEQYRPRSQGVQPALYGRAGPPQSLSGTASVY